MRTEQVPLLAAGAGVASFVLGRFLLRPSSDGTTAPAAAAVDPNAGDQTNATVDQAGVLQGIGQGTDGTGLIDPAPIPPYPLPVPPKPVAYPIPGIKPPTGAVAVAHAANLKTLYSVSGGVATGHAYSGLSFTAYVSSAAKYRPNATLRRILSGSHAGMYVHPGDSGLSITSF